MPSFKDQIRAFNKKAEKAADMVFRGTALDLFSSIVQRTPVDTGRLRGNWQVGINSPGVGALYAEDKGGSKAQKRAASGVKRAGIGDSIFITNNLPYAKAIEYGHSAKQAPNGMVRVTVAEFKQHVKRNARKARGKL